MLKKVKVKRFKIGQRRIYRSQRCRNSGRLLEHKEKAEMGKGNTREKEIRLKKI